MSLISYDKDCTIFTSQEKSEMLEIFQRIKQVMLTPLHFEIFTLAMLYHTELYEDIPSLSAYRSVADRLVETDSKKMRLGFCNIVTILRA